MTRHRQGRKKQYATCASQLLLHPPDIRVLQHVRTAGCSSRCSSSHPPRARHIGGTIHSRVNTKRWFMFVDGEKTCRSTLLQTSTGNFHLRVSQSHCVPARHRTSFRKRNCAPCAEATIKSKDFMVHMRKGFNSTGARVRLLCTAQRFPPSYFSKRFKHSKLHPTIASTFFQSIQCHDM